MTHEQIQKLVSPLHGINRSVQPARRPIVHSAIVLSALAIPEAPPHQKRRATDAAESVANRPAYRDLAEEAYRLYREDGCQRERILDYWQRAEAIIFNRASSSQE
jgi:hypothetical protein